jgi:hypothetical protein
MLRKVVLAGIVLAMAAAAVDFLRPAAVHPRRFDSADVARSETDMWRAYYEHRPVHLFGILVGELHRQYGLSYTRSVIGAYYAAQAAVVFQKGKQRSDYEKALPDLERYYALLRRGSDVVFDTPTVARAELEWWIAHRDRRQDLPHTLAVLQADFYGIPAERFQTHADARARAMIYRDDRGAAITDADWRQIEGWLNESWSSLHQAVQ